MKNFKKVLALVLVIASLLTVASAARPYEAYKDADAISADYTVAVDVLKVLKVMVGNDKEEFNAKSTITREEAAKVIAIFDNRSADISTLYTSANDFADVVGRWSESYIGYCFRAGIVVGPRPNMFEPTKNVTGTEFLKMVLVTLGYDATKEGFVGNSWKTNVLSLAKTLGLYAGIKDFDPAADLTREEAAQILFNALQKDTVQYGNKIVYNTNKEDGAYNYVTVAGAQKTGEKLMAKFGLSSEADNDAFMRPVTNWLDSKGNVLCTIMDTPVAEWTTRFDGCELLVAAGIEKTNSTKTLTFSAFENGTFRYGKTEKHTAELYCDAAKDYYGAQGTLAQLFKLADGSYRLTFIETWLAKVTDATADKAYASGHVKTSYKLDLEIYDANKGWNAWNETINNYEHEAEDTTKGLAKGDYVLVNCSWKSGESGLKNVVLAESYEGTLSGFTTRDLAQAAGYTSTKIDGESTPDADKFALGYEASKATANMGDAFTFFFDAYGNVIGMADLSEAAKAQYAVLDSAWSHTHKTYTVTGDVVMLDASKVADAEIKALIDTATFNGLSALATANEGLCKTLYTYTEKDGAYKLYNSDTIVKTNASASIYAGDPNLFFNNNTVYTNEYTQYLFYNANTKEYVAYTGYKDVKSCVLSDVEYVMASNDRYAAIVFGKVASFPGESSVAYVVNPIKRETILIGENSYEVYTVYVDGVATTVYAEADNLGLFTKGNGLYELSFVEDENGVVVVATDKVFFFDFQYVKVVDCTDTSLVLTGVDRALNVTDIPVYCVDMYNKTLEPAETADIKTGDFAALYRENGEIVAVYVYINA